MGYEADIFEAKDKPSGLTVYGIAPYKITNEEVLDEIAYLQDQLGFSIKYNTAVTSKQDIEKLEQDYDAIFLGVGLGKTAELSMPGEDKEGVYGAVEFIEDLRMNHHATYVGNKVVVIGGGNTAMDAASESARMGATTVTLAYRRGKDEMGAYGFEYRLAIGAGGDGLFNAQPLEILGNGKVNGVRFIRTEVVDGKLEEIQGSDFIVECDMVIKATGQAKQGSFYELIDNLDLDEVTRIIVSKTSFQTSNPRYFAGGDAVNGGAEVVNAADDGKKAAHGIHNYLKD